MTDGDQLVAASVLTAALTANIVLIAIFQLQSLYVAALGGVAVPAAMALLVSYHSPRPDGPGAVDATTTIDNNDDDDQSLSADGGIEVE